MRTIAHISDLHFGAHDRTIVDDLLSSLAAQRPDVVVISGDLTQRARTEQFLEARRFLDAVGRPLLVVPGNHDIPLYNVFRRLAVPRRSYRKHIVPVAIPEAFYSDEKIAILGLDTVRRLKWKEGRVSFEQMARIQTLLGALPPHIWKIVVTHHPIALAAEGPSSPMAARANLTWPTLAKAQVHLALSGHHHYAVSGEGAVDLAAQRSILAIHAGTAVSTRTRAAQKNSYNLIALEPPRAMVQIMEWRSGSGFGESHHAAYVLDGNRWRAANGLAHGAPPSRLSSI